MENSQNPPPDNAWPVVRRDCRQPGDWEDAVLEAVERLARGEIVGLATPQGYWGVIKATSASETIACGEVAATLLSDPARLACVSPVLWLRDVEELSDFWPEVPVVAQRLLQRFPPGTMQVVLPACQLLFSAQNTPDRSWQRELLGGMMPLLQQTTVGQTGIAVGLAGGKVAQALQKISPWPLWGLQPRIPADWEEEADSGQGMVPQGLKNLSSLEKLLPNCLSYSLDEGPLSECSLPSRVEIQDRGVKIIQSHQYTEALIMERTGPSVLFVCTGNTCRSPMAEAICRKMLAERLQCSVEDLASRGVEIRSAGIAAEFGYPASSETVHLMAEAGIDLADHQSQPLTAPLLDRLDQIYTMTAQHRAVILNHRPDLIDRISVLGVEQRDIPDPIGAGMDAYRHCQKAIEAGLTRVVDGLVAELS